MSGEIRGKPHFCWIFCESDRSNPRNIGIGLGYTPLKSNRYWDDWDQRGRGVPQIAVIGVIAVIADIEHRTHWDT